MDDSIGFVVYVYERVLPYLAQELASAVWELGPAKLSLAFVMLLGVIKGLEITFWLLRRLWLPLAAMLTLGGLTLALRS